MEEVGALETALDSGLLFLQAQVLPLGAILRLALATLDVEASQLATESPCTRLPMITPTDSALETELETAFLPCATLPQQPLLLLPPRLPLLLQPPLLLPPLLLLPLLLLLRLLPLQLLPLLLLRLKLLPLPLRLLLPLQLLLQLLTPFLWSTPTALPLRSWRL